MQNNNMLSVRIDKLKKCEEYDNSSRHAILAF